MKTPADYWQFIKSEEGPNYNIFKVQFDTLLNLRNQKKLKATILHSNDSVNVVALTREKEIVLAQQYRFGTRQNTYELPGGFLDHGEDHRTAAIRELEEETGYTGAKWSYLGFIGNNPAFMNSYIHHYLLEEAELSTTPVLDDGENVTTVTLSFAKLKELLKANRITHPHTLSGLARVFNLYGGIEL